MPAKVALNRLDRDQAHIRPCLQSIHDLTRETSHQLRGLLHVLDDHCSTWAEFSGNLRAWSEQLLEPWAVTFDFAVSPSVHDLPPPSVRLRVELYRLYREILLNALNHARAEKWHSSAPSQSAVSQRNAWC